MDKKLRTILILAGILVLLCIGYAVAGLVFKEDTPEDTTAPETTAEEATFLQVTEDGLTKLSYTYDKDGDGKAEVWSYTRSEDGESWHWDEDPAVPLGSSAFYGYSSTLYGIQVVNTLQNVTEEQFSEYGLTAPARTVTFTDRVYGEQSFCIGAFNTYNSTYCAYRPPRGLASLCWPPLYYVCSPGHKGHDDLTSSPPSSVLSTAVSLECSFVATNNRGCARCGT